MNIKNCKRCKRIFNYIAGEPYCPVCKEEMETIFYKVKDYLREHPGSTAAEVSEECGVSVEQINKWLREGRLELTEDSAITLSCKSCGAPIRSGNLCGMCEQSLKRSFQDIAMSRNANAKVDTPNKGKVKMHTHTNRE